MIYDRLNKNLAFVRASLEACGSCLINESYSDINTGTTKSKIGSTKRIIGTMKASSKIDNESVKSRALMLGHKVSYRRVKSDTSGITLRCNMNN